MLGEHSIEMFGETYTLQICASDELGKDGQPASARLADPQQEFPKFQVKEEKTPEAPKQNEKKSKGKNKSPKGKLEKKKDWTPRVTEGPLSYVQRPGGNVPKGKYKVIVDAPGLRGRRLEQVGPTIHIRNSSEVERSEEKFGSLNQSQEIPKLGEHHIDDVKWNPILKKDMNYDEQ